MAAEGWAIGYCLPPTGTLRTVWDAFARQELGFLQPAHGILSIVSTGMFWVKLLPMVYS